MAACLAMGAAPALAQEDYVGQVKKMSGQVEVGRDGKALPAKVGSRLLPGDVVTTGPEGSVGLIFHDDSGSSLGPDSHMNIKDFAFDPARDKLSFWANLKKGTMVYFSGVIAKLRRNRVKIETPTVLMGVRGTRFAVKVE